MKNLTTLTILVVTLASSVLGQVRQDSFKRVVLPNPQLLRCVSTNCAQLWQDKAPDTESISPVQLVIDLTEKPCPLAVLARYDKSVRFEDLKATIDTRYGKWAFPDNDTRNVKLWRVEPDKFSIQLSTADKHIADEFHVEVGAQTIVYMAFQPTKCGAQ